MLFNIYYINFSKVYEIKMMLSNIIQTDASVEITQQEQDEDTMEAKLGVKFLNYFTANAGGSSKTVDSDSQRVLENFKVTTTKSIILSEVLDRCKNIENFDGIKEGALIRVDNVTLSLENEAELRMAKIFASGSFKGMRIPEAGGLDFNNIINGVLKDYSYKIKGVTRGIDAYQGAAIDQTATNNLMMKIPMSFESEFENAYNVDDLFIGTVTLIGIYKGTVKVNQLQNSFEFFQEIGNMQSNDGDTEIKNSQYQKKDKPQLKSYKDPTDYHYVDLLAVVQSIESDTDGQDSSLDTPKKKKPRKQSDAT